MLCPALECDPVHIHATDDGDVLDSLEADLYVSVQHSTTDPGQHLTAGHGDPWTDLMQPQAVHAEVQCDLVRCCLRVRFFLSLRQVQCEWPIEHDRDDGPLSLDRLYVQPIQPEYPSCSVQLAGLLDHEIQRRRIGRRGRHVQLKTAATQIGFPSHLAVVHPELSLAID